MSKLKTIHVPACSKEFARTVQKVFPKIDIKPGTTLEEIMYNTGAQAVVEYVLRVANEQIVSGDPDELRLAGSTGALDKALGNKS